MLFRSDREIGTLEDELDNKNAEINATGNYLHLHAELMAVASVHLIGALWNMIVIFNTSINF